MTESTTRKPRKREPKDNPTANWKIGNFDISCSNGVYEVRYGKSLLMRTTDEHYFKDYCALLEQRAK